MQSPKPRSLRQRIGLILGPLLFFTLLLLPFGDAPTVSRMAAIAALMATWWITEAIPIPATALLPIVLYPLMGIAPPMAPKAQMAGQPQVKGQAQAKPMGEMKGTMKPMGEMKGTMKPMGEMKGTMKPMGEMKPKGEMKKRPMSGITYAYAHHFVFLFMGGFIIALALRRWDLHRRIALNIIRRVGQDPRRLVLGFMLATAALSMWICNAATTMTMVPIALSVITLLRERSPDAGLTARFPMALLLGVCYAASIGGFGTLVGMMTNLSFARSYAHLFPELAPIGFVDWMLMALPFALIFLAITWALLVYVLFPLGGEAFGGAEIIKEEHAKLGVMTPAERRVALIFGLVILAWVFRQEIAVGGAFTIPGWTGLLTAGLTRLGIQAPHLTKLVNNGTIAMAGALLLFLTPSGREGGERLMDWEHAKRLPWGLLLLFGGGFAMAKGFMMSGLSAWIGHQLSFLQGASSPLLVTAISAGVSGLTELSSNVATVEMILPVLAGVAREIGAHPLLLMLPAALAASSAFMLPIATPPNAIVFGTGEIPMTQMVRAGLIINIVGLVLIVSVSFTLGRWVFGF